MATHVGADGEDIEEERLTTPGEATNEGEGGGVKRESEIESQETGKDPAGTGRADSSGDR